MHSIFLIGFMGAGKSTLGKLLAQKLERRYLDLDEEIVKVSGERWEVGGNTVSALVGNVGMHRFRELESETLKNTDWGNCVVACGGGTPCFYNNIAWMKTQGKVVFMKVTEEQLFTRLKATNLNERPLLRGKTDDELKAFIRSTLSQRLSFYTQAHIIFDAEKGDVDELIKNLESGN